MQLYLAAVAIPSILSPSVLALTLPNSLHLPPQINASSLAVLSAHHTNLTTPPHPPGFSITYQWKPNSPLPQLATYIAAIRAIHDLATLGWYSHPTASFNPVFPSQDSSVLVKISDIPPSTDLQNGHLILTIRESIFRMARQMPGFYSLVASPRLHSQKVANIEFAATGRPSSEARGRLTDNEGVLIVPGLPRAKVRWKYKRKGLTISAQDVFTAIIDAMSVSAAKKQSKECDREGVAGLSTTGMTVVDVARMRGGQGEGVLSCGVIESVLLGIAEGVFEKTRRFSEMGFEIFWDGRVVGVGVLFYRGPLAGLADS